MAKIGVYSDENFRKLLEVLKEIELSGREVSVQELATESHYKETSIRTYISKKLKNYLVYPSQKGKYTVSGALSLSDQDFLNHMSQKSPAINASAKGLAPRLSRRSLEAYYLAIELYNRPILPNKIEAFCIMMVNAWELLLKAEIVSNDGEDALFYKGEPSRSLALRNVLKRIFQNEHDPVRKNIEFLADMRDQAVHLLIPELQGHLSRLFQASAFNFLDRYSRITNVKPSEDLGFGLISMVVDRDDLSSAVLKDTYEESTAKEISTFLDRFRTTERELSSTQFAIPIEYKLVLTKKVGEGDLSLSSAQDGATAYLIEVPKDVDRTHPYRQNDAIEKIKESFPAEITNVFNSYDFQAILYKQGIRTSKSNQYYHLIENPKTHRYSQRFVEFVVDKVCADPSFLSRCRDSYRHHQQKKNDLRKSKISD